MDICPNTNDPDVARDFEELKNATSEQAAYHIWSLNNGNAIDKAPNGADSILFRSLLEELNGDRVKAIKEKAKVYSKSFLNWFGDWINDPTDASKVVDENGEPLVVYHGSKEKFTTFNKNTKNRGSLTSIIKKGFYFSNKNIASQYASSKAKEDLFKYMEYDDGGFSFEEIAEAFGFNRYDDKELEKAAAYIMSLEERTADFSDNLYAVFLNIKNPAEVDLNGKYIGALNKTQRDAINNSQGAIIKNVDETTSRYRGEITTPGMYVGTDYIVFEPNQIKSAIDNGQFYKDENGNLRFEGFSTTDDDILRNILTEREYVQMLEELSLSRDKAEDFIYNFITKILNVNPNYKVDNKSDSFAYAALDRWSFQDYDRINNLAKRIFGYDVWLSVGSKEKFEQSLRNAIDEWVDNLEKKLYNQQDLDTLFKFRRRDTEILNSLYRFAKHKFDDSKLSEQDKLNVQRKLDIHPDDTKDRIRKATFKTINDLKKDIDSSNRSIQNTIYATAAIRTAVKNRIVALNTIDNLKQLVYNRLMAEYESYNVSEEDLNKFDHLIPLYNSIITNVDVNKVDSELRPTYIIEGLNEVQDWSTTQLKDWIVNQYPEYATLVDLFISANPELNIKVGGEKPQTAFGIEQGHFSPKTNILRLYNGTDILTVIHELSHAATYFGIVGRESEEQQLLEQSINKFMDYIREYIKENQLNPDLFIPSSFRGVQAPADVYGFTNASEFIAELYSNTEFRTLLSLIPAMDKKQFKSILQQIWNTIIDYFYKLFGKHIDKTALDQAKKLGFIAMQLQQQHIDAIYELLEKYNQPTQQNILRSDNDNSLENNELPISKDFADIQIELENQQKEFVQSEMKSISYDTEGDVVSQIQAAEYAATQHWGDRVQQQIMGQTQQTLASAFGLYRNEDGTWSTTNTDENSQLQVQFVNTLGNGHAGSYTANQESELAHHMIMIALDEADASTFNHELAHYYVRKFWNTKVIQDALKSVDKPGMTDEQREEALVEKMTELSMDNIYNDNQKSWFSKLWNRLSMLIHNVFNITNAEARRTLVENAAKAFIVNQQLTQNEKGYQLYNKYNGTVYQSRRSRAKTAAARQIKERDVLRPISDTLSDEVAAANIINYSISRAKAASINGTISQKQASTIFNLVAVARKYGDRIKQARITTDIVAQKDAKLTLFNQFLDYVSEDIRDTLDILIQNETNGLSIITVDQMFALQTDVVGYYYSLINDISQFTSDAAIASTYDKDQIDDLHRRVLEKQNEIAVLNNKFKLQQKQVVYNIMSEIIENSMEDYVGENEQDAKEWITRAKISLRRWLNDDNLFGDIAAFTGTVIGLSSHSKSILIRAAHDILDDCMRQIRINAKKEADHLRDLLYAARAEWHRRGNILGFEKQFIERDIDSGLPTGNFVQSLNWGTWNNRKEAYQNKLLYGNGKWGIEKGYEKQIRERLNDDSFELTIDEFGFPEFPDGFEDLEKDYLLKMNEWHARNSVRRFTPQYYEKRYEILSIKTLRALRMHNNSINEILSLCRNDEGKVDLNLLTPVQQRELTYRQYAKEELSNFYYPNGTRKTDEDLQIAEELYQWHKFTKDSGIVYTPNIDEYQKVEDNSPDKDRFRKQWTTKIINPELFEQLPNGYSDYAERFGLQGLKDDLDKLVYQRNQLLKIFKNYKKGTDYKFDIQKIWDDSTSSIRQEWVPLLDELSVLEYQINKLRNRIKEEIKAKGFIIDKVEQSDILEQNEQMHPTANVSWFDYISKKLYNKYRAQQATNPRWRDEFRKQLSLIKTGPAVTDAQLSIFYSTDPINSGYAQTSNMRIRHGYLHDETSGQTQVTTVDIYDDSGNVAESEKYASYVRTIPGIFNELDVKQSSDVYVDKTFEQDQARNGAVHPIRAGYDNTERLQKIKGKSKELYDAMIDGMRASFQRAGMTKHDYDYRMPQIGGTTMQLTKRRMNFIKTMARWFRRELEFVETDDFFNNDWSKRPDGSIIQNPKLRYIKRLDDPEYINTDVVGCVIKFIEMSHKYAEKKKHQGKFEMLLNTLKSNKGNDRQSRQQDVLEHMMNTQLYDRGLTFNNSGKLTNTLENNKKSRSALKMLRQVRIILQISLLCWNTGSAIVSALDPWFKLFLDAITGKYNNIADVLRAVVTLLCNSPAALLSSGRSRTLSKAQAIMQEYGVARSIGEIYSGLDKTSVIRFMSGLGMKAFQFGDYTTSAVTIVATMKNFRFYEASGNTNIKSGFYQRDEYIKVAMKDGHDKKEAKNLYGDAINAYSMYDYSKPKLGLRVRNSGKYSEASLYFNEKTKSRIEKSAKSRISIYNGIVQGNEKVPLQTNIWYSFVSMLRNFLLVGINERFKNLRDFQVDPSELAYELGQPQKLDRYGNPVKYTNRQIKLTQMQYVGGWNFQTRQLETGVYTGLSRVVRQFFRNFGWLVRFLSSNPSSLGAIFKGKKSKKYANYLESHRSDIWNPESLTFNKVDMYGLQKFLLEMSTIGALWCLWAFAVVPWASDPDNEDNYWVQLVNYENQRLIVELSTWISPLTVSDIINSITPASGDLKRKSHILNVVGDVYSAINGEPRTIKRGAYKGLPAWIADVGSTLGPIGNMITNHRVEGIKSKCSYYQKIGPHYWLYKTIYGDQSDNKSNNKSSNKTNEKLGNKLGGGKLGGKLKNK